jgi:hypothetical protein
VSLDAFNLIVGNNASKSMEKIPTAYLNVLFFTILPFRS